MMTGYHGVLLQSGAPRQKPNQGALVCLDGPGSFFASRRRHTRLQGDWSSDVCSSDLERAVGYKAATLTVTFLFYNLLEGAATSDAAVLFQGIVNPPDQ